MVQDSTYLLGVVSASWTFAPNQPRLVLTWAARRSTHAKCTQVPAYLDRE